jgi:hypothetical protein|tara:strand:- start:564 stop:797 length:234 start_codon:yes stop_codon:yes gene_type:complete
MIKIWLLLMIISMPGQPSVKYTASIYSDEEKCLVAQDGYNTAYKNKDQDYKSRVKSEAFCISFEAFPIAGLQSSMGA